MFKLSSQPRFLLAVLLALPASSQQGSELDYAAEARAFLEENGQPTSGITFQEFLDGPAFVRVELGSFDLRLPAAALGEKVLAGRTREAAETLVALQRAWYGWTGTGRDHEDLDDDWATLEKWVKGWSERKLGKCEGGEGSLFEQLGAKDKVVEAAARLSEVTRYPKETASLVGDRNLTVLAPDRETYVKTAAVGGLLDTAKRPTLWHASMVGQGAAWFDWIQIIALEGSGGVDGSRPYSGVDYKDVGKTGLAQQVADRGGIILLRKAFVRQGTHFFEQTLATNLVIETVGENGVNSFDWDMRSKREGASTDPYVRFVPGGNSNGGLLPPRTAHSGPTKYSTSVTSAEVGRYRSNLGAGFFVDPLRKGQREGAKLALRDEEVPFRKDKRPHFELYSLETRSPTCVTAPFLGRPAEEKALPPKEFIDDYEDFFRAYRSGFVHWLRTRAGDQAETSPDLFAELVRKHAERASGEDLDDVVEEVYGVPLSGADDSTNSLEWRFLGWLENGD